MEALLNNVEYKTSAFLFARVDEATAVRYALGRTWRQAVQTQMLCAIDSDPVAYKNNDLITGESTSVCMDLLER